MKQQTTFWWAIDNHNSSQAIQLISLSMREKYMRIARWGLALACLFGILFFTEGTYASDHRQTATSILQQDQEPFRVEMFPGEHMSIPGKTIAAKIDFFNDPTALNGIALENTIITVVVPESSYFNATESDAGWVCDVNGEEGDSCHFTVGLFTSDEGGSLRFAATMYANSTEVIVVDEIVLTASLHADNLPEAAIELFQSDFVIGMSAPTNSMETEEPIQNFKVFLPMIIGG